jgi:hypothetical protein
MLKFGGMLNIIPSHRDSHIKASEETIRKSYREQLAMPDIDAVLVRYLQR